MLAGVPRTVAELLREAGVPAQSLPQVPLFASGAGRFVLFDSRRRESAVQVRGARDMGLHPIDINELAPWLSAAEPPRSEGERHAPRYEASGVRLFFERLKETLESQRGVWARIADYPFPYQSAIALALEYGTDDLHEIEKLGAVRGGKATHFVPSRLRAERLNVLKQSGALELGWRIGANDFERTSRRTLSHWRTRMARFAAAGLVPGGLMLDGNSPVLPSGPDLEQFGFGYCCRAGERSGCRTGEIRGPSRGWTEILAIEAARLSTGESGPSLGEHYQSGRPLFLMARVGSGLHALMRASAEAARCSLMWHTSLGQFSQWWRARRELRLTVWRTSSGCEIHAAGDLTGNSWALELWRGGHVATLPIRQPEAFVPDDGLIYLQSSRKDSAGCVAPGGELDSLAARHDARRLRGRIRLSRPRFPRKGTSE